MDNTNNLPFQSNPDLPWYDPLSDTTLQTPAISFDQSSETAEPSSWNSTADQAMMMHTPDAYEPHSPFSHTSPMANPLISQSIFLCSPSMSPSPQLHTWAVGSPPHGPYYRSPSRSSSPLLANNMTMETPSISHSPLTLPPSYAQSAQPSPFALPESLFQCFAPATFLPQINTIPPRRAKEACFACHLAHRRCEGYPNCERCKKRDMVCIRLEDVEGEGCGKCKRCAGLPKKRSVAFNTPSRD